jgi:uncharacterized protein
MVIDFHVHCFPDPLASRAMSALTGSSGIAGHLDGTVSDLKKSMRRAGIDLSVVLSIATKPSQTQPVNSWAAEIQDESVIALGSLHPGYEGWREEIQRMRELGLKGVKLHPDYQQFYVDDEKVFPIYEELMLSDLLILFHAGIDVGLPHPCHCPPERLARVTQAFPAARIVAAHMGGYLSWDAVEEHLVGSPLFFDTSYGLGYMEDSQFLRILAAHGPDRVLFGTDSPWDDQAIQKARVENLELPAETRAAILGGNACRLLGIG